MLWYLACDLLTDEPKGRVKLVDVEYGPDLGLGGGALTARAPAANNRDVSDLLAEARTALYVYDGTALQWGGIAWSCRPDGSGWKVAGAGFGSYLFQREVRASLGPYVKTDPLAITRALVAYANSLPGGDIGLRCTEDISPMRVGTTEDPIRYDWWESPGVAESINQLAEGDGDHAFDILEEVTDLGGQRRKTLRLGYPYAGRRTGYRLTNRQSANVVAIGEIGSDGLEYANDVQGLGVGDGAKMLRSIRPQADRRGYPLLQRTSDYKGVTSARILDSLTYAELVARSTPGDVPELTLRDCPSAPKGALAPGDYVDVDLSTPVYRLSAGCRILGLRYSSRTPDRYKVRLARADSFTYGSAA